LTSMYGQGVGRTDEWYTPPHVFEALDCEFDVDAASPGAAITPWIPARRFITQNSLTSDWGTGLVWLNPPFGKRGSLVPWLNKFFRHANGVMLVPDRTSAPWWQEYVPYADLVLFVAPKLKFIGADGKPGTIPADGTCLLACGTVASIALVKAQRAGLGVLMSPRRDLLP